MRAALRKWIFGGVVPGWQWRDFVSVCHHFLPFLHSTDWDEETTNIYLDIFVNSLCMYTMIGVTSLIMKIVGWTNQNFNKAWGIDHHRHCHRHGYNEAGQGLISCGLEPGPNYEGSAAHNHQLAHNQLLGQPSSSASGNSIIDIMINMLKGLGWRRGQWHQDHLIYWTQWSMNWKDL